MEQKVELAINNSVWLKPPRVQNANQLQGKIICGHVSYVMFPSTYNFRTCEAGMKT